MNKLISLTLRALTLGSKFILIFYMARFFSLEDIGYYSLLAASIGYSLYLLGFDFYTYASREMLATTKENWPQLLREQIIFYIFSYAIALPIFLGLFLIQFLPWQFLIWFYLILILEHISQEIMRFFVIAGKGIYANFLLFIRVSAWCYLAIFVMFFNPNLNQLTTIFAFWMTGIIVSLLFSIQYIYSLNWNVLKRKSIDWIWIKKGIKIAFPLLIATLALRTLFIADKYILQWQSGVKSVAVYSFFSSFANALLAFIDAAVIIHHYPKVVSHFKENNLVGFYLELRLFLKEILKVGIVVSVCLIILMPFLLDFIDKIEFKAELVIFYVLLINMFIYSISLIPHYALYAQGKDRQIVLSSLCTMIIGMFFMVVFGFHLKIIGIALGQTIAMISLFVFKYYFLKKGERVG